VRALTDAAKILRSLALPAARDEHLDHNIFTTWEPRHTIENAHLGPNIGHGQNLAGNSRRIIASVSPPWERLDDAEPIC